MKREPDDWDDPLGAETYSELARGGELYRTLGRRLVELADPRPGELWIDLACGTGLVTELIAAHAGRTVRIAGLDRAGAMLVVAVRQVPLDGVVFARADPSELPLASGEADGLVCSAAFWHFPAPDRVWSEAARVLRPGGRVAINVPVSQLEGERDAPATPLQIELAAVGRRRFGESPAPAGPLRSRRSLLEQACEAGFEVGAEQVFEVLVRQEELAQLLHVPAIGARMYPLTDDASREAWIDESAGRIDLSEEAPVRWWQACLRRAGPL
ncbi:MAG: methyltransferase domain-containing protein [Acidobacteriota bacterium]|nr:methyltransferase domain-containing protein [Acidobacteriota bacterium]